MKKQENNTWASNGHRPDLKYFKVVPEAHAPEWATAHSGCFDLKACLVPGTSFTVYRENNEKIHNTVGRQMLDDGMTVKSYLNIFAGERVLVPTGLILDIPFGYKVDLYARSGLALKQGLILANNVGKIDSDYVEPTFIILHNTSTVMATIFHGDRIAQGEMVLDIGYDLIETPDKPGLKTDRKGGFGSTGVSS
jgi:dUTP pyrophosphatase